MFNSLEPYGLQHASLLCPSLSPRVCSNLRPLSQWCYLTISSSAVPFSFCLQSFPASGYFLVSWLFASGGQTFGASATVLPMNIQGWFPLGLTGLISLQSKGTLPGLAIPLKTRRKWDKIYETTFSGAENREIRITAFGIGMTSSGKPGAILLLLHRQVSLARQVR